MDANRAGGQLAHLDESQAAAFALAQRKNASIIGAAGTGKTYLLTQLAIAAEEEQRRVAVITQDRESASLLRNLVTARLGYRSELLSVQSLTAFAYSLVQMYAQAVGRRDPELISGPDEAARLREILSVAGEEISFPAFVSAEIRALPGFQEQIRNLMTRARELGISPRELRDLAGRENVSPLHAQMWKAVAQIMELYATVSEMSDSGGQSDAPDRLDHAQLVLTASDNLAHWESNVRASSRYQGGRPERPRWDVIIVDDVQNAPRSIIFLLRQLMRDGARIITAGDPDSCVEGFRGAVSSLPGDLTKAKEFGGLGLEPVYLRQQCRSGGRLLAVQQRLASALKVSGGTFRQRQAVVGSGQGEKAAGGAPSVSRNTESDASATRGKLRGASFRHEEEENAYLASYVETLHRTEGCQYSDIAIITRSRASHEAIRDALVRRGISMQQIGSNLPLRANPAVASLLELVRAAFSSGENQFVDAAEVDFEALLRSPVLGVDPLTIKREGRRLRAWALNRGEHTPESDLRREVLLGSRSLGEETEIVPEMLRVAKILAQIRQCGEDQNMSAERVLWTAWDSAKRAEAWRAEALQGGIEAESANENLDAIIRLFRIAQRLTDRDPNTRIERLLDEVESQDLPEDSIARLGVTTDAVALSTPSSAQGREWKHVVIPRLNEGAWPNLRPRDAFTGTDLLAKIVTGRIPENQSAVAPASEVDDVLDDELRQLYFAVSRASESVLVTAVENESDHASRFFPVLGFSTRGAGASAPAPIGPAAGVTGQRAAVAGEENRRPHVRGRDLNSDEWGLTRPLGSVPVVDQPHGQRTLDATATVALLRRIIAEVSGEESELVPRSESRGGSAAAIFPAGEAKSARRADASVEASRANLERLREAHVREAEESFWFDSLDTTAGAGKSEGVAPRDGKPRTVEPSDGKPRTVEPSDGKQGAGESGTGDAPLAKVSVSPSAVEGLLESPLGGFISEIGARSETDLRAAHLGTIIHSIAQDFSNNPDLTSMEARLKELWPKDPEGYFEEHDFKIAEGMVGVLQNMLQDDYGKSGLEVQTEVPLDADGPAGSYCKVFGKIDRRLTEGGSTEVVDIKTGKTRPTAEAAADNPQMQIYQWLLKQAGKTLGGARLVYPRYTDREGKIFTREQDPLDENALKRAEERISIAAKLKRETYVPVREEEDHSKGVLRFISPLTDEGRLFS
ncbi:ATP-dependent DNA helicase [Actinobaculum massiliense]|uniref:ATP-dependent DNA helicase n=1 Tax=Actinobaculum massiliense TaxID=202789 RepID=UPI002549EA2C|nr:ATP-dependent DNA helicase [Actinobaculum massiliense]MDK8567453.1 ATP-dependent DNA helicase [Actinobaculum massiliense]